MGDKELEELMDIRSTLCASCPKVKELEAKIKQYEAEIKELKLDIKRQRSYMSSLLKYSRDYKHTL